MLTITKEFLFDAAHKLWRSELSDDENHALYGKCSRFHGHTYRLRITVSGTVGPDGMIINFEKLKKLVTDSIIERYDHAYLNELEEYQDLPVTAENMVQYIFNVLASILYEEKVALESVVLYETPTSWATMTRDS
ncbi:6-pyruvoyl trahydropterin synthase family protein [Desulfamplus magnetovallimortis]|nr:6-carboxytetrahydropterin synthase [Desulfamplus magnetovallimortis]